MAAPSHPADPIVARHSLASRTLPVLEARLRSGLWGDVLPGERKLAEMLQVSRMTLRQALAELERRGWVSSGQGQRRRILRQPRQKVRSCRSVVFLSPLPIQEMEPQLILLIHHLSEALKKKDFTLEIEARPSCFSRRPDRALAALVADLCPAGWIVFRGNQTVQEWFHRSELPFVVVGSTFISGAPSFGSEHMAVSAHAAAQFLRLGHRHGAIIAPRRETIALSDDALARGFRQAGFQCHTVFHNRSRRGILQSLDAALALRPRVSALFTIGGQYTVTLLSSLLHRGLRVPEEMSLIAMGNDPAFSYLFPTPAHYEFSTEKAARLLFRLVCRVVLDGDRTRSQIQYLPDFIPGESLGRAAKDH